MKKRSSLIAFAALVAGSNSALAGIPFVIAPTPGKTLPSTVPQGGTVHAYYTVSNLSQRLYATKASCNRKTRNS